MTGQVRYALRYQVFPYGPKSEDQEVSQKDVQKLVDASLGLLTGSCEVCVYSRYEGAPSLYCDKHARRVNLGDPRCQYFTRKPSMP